MKILHVTLGNPKTHIGGLSTYCKDLMTEERNSGEQAAVLFAGSYNPGKAPIIKKSTSVNGCAQYALNNCLPIAITYGIDEPSRYMVPSDRKYFCDWLSKEKPDVIHVHSIMGIYREFFQAASDLHIPMMFTTHDYYPMCFKCNLMSYDGSLCLDSILNDRCAVCNAGCGLTDKKQRILQSELYQKVKNWKILAWIKRVKGNPSKNINISENNNIVPTDEFEKLHEYYQSIFDCFTLIHCNSLVTKQLYGKYYPDANYMVLPITHRGISRSVHKRSDDKLHISYFGGMSIHKGYGQLKCLIAKLEQNDIKKWDIHLYGGDFTENFDDERIIPVGAFTSNEADKVWNNTDLLLFISQWPETFGFATLEAISRGIPVICSDIVGSSYLLKQVSEECIYHYNDDKELYSKTIRFLDRDYYDDIVQKLMNIAVDTEMDQHSKKIISLYEKLKSL